MLSNNRIDDDKLDEIEKKLRVYIMKYYLSPAIVEVAYLAAIELANWKPFDQVNLDFPQEQFETDIHKLKQQDEIVKLISMLTALIHKQFPLNRIWNMTRDGRIQYAEISQQSILAHLKIVI